MRARLLTSIAIAATAVLGPGCKSGTHAATADPSPSGAVHADAAVDADAAARGPAAPAVAWDSYFAIAPRADDAWTALQATYAALPAAGPATLAADTVVLCRFDVVEPAPKPASRWDQANGRDLALETLVDGSPVDRREGPLGQPWLVVRIDEHLRSAPADKALAFRLRDRDQTRAYPYVNSIALGSIDLAANRGVPASAKAPTVRMECRAAPLGVAAEALLPAADRALLEAEAKATWPPGAPPTVDALRWDLAAAADAIRVGEHLAGGRAELLGRWREREERLRRVARRHDADARAAHAAIAPAPIGEWVAVGKSLSARVGGILCPPIPKGADPGSLNDDQREGCGLVLELRSSAPMRFEANPWGPAYACRMTGDIRIGMVTGPGADGGVCVLGIRRGAGWLKGTVDLLPTQPTTLVLGGAAPGVPLRVRLGDASAVLATPAAAP